MRTQLLSYSILHTMRIKAARSKSAAGRKKYAVRKVRERLLQENDEHDEAVPVLLQNPTFKTTGFRYGFPVIHRLGQVLGVLLDYGLDKVKPWGQVTNYVSVEARSSNVPDAGVDLFANQVIMKDQLLTEYRGKRISEAKAGELQLQVLILNFCRELLRGGSHLPLLFVGGRSVCQTGP